MEPAESHDVYLVLHPFAGNVREFRILTRPLGDLDLRWMMPYFPGVMVFFAWAMVSGWRVPKLGKARNRFVNIFVLVNMISGYTACMLQLIPEYLVIGAWFYLRQGVASKS